MSATQQNFSFALGEDWVIDFEASDAAGNRIENGQVEAVEFILGRGAREVLRRDLDNGIVNDNDTPPDWIIGVTPAAQSALTPGVYDYEVWVTLADGARSLQAYGTVDARATMGGQ